MAAVVRDLANLHGGFFYGCITLVLYAVGELAEGWLVLGDARRGMVRPGAPPPRRGGPRAPASLLNPNGWHLLAHVAGFFGNSAILARPRSS